MRQPRLPVITLLTSEALKMINITSSPHHHLEGRNNFVAGRTEARVAEQPQVISLAQHQIAFRVQRRADLAQPAITAAAL